MQHISFQSIGGIGRNQTFGPTIKFVYLLHCNLKKIIQSRMNIFGNGHLIWTINKINEPQLNAFEFVINVFILIFSMLSFLWLEKHFRHLTLLVPIHIIFPKKLIEIFSI